MSTQTAESSAGHYGDPETVSKLNEALRPYRFTELPETDLLTLAATEKSLRLLWKIPSLEEIERANTELLAKDGLLRIGVFGFGVAGKTAAEVTAKNGGIAIVFGERIGGQAQNSISEYIHTDTRHDGGGREVMKGLTRPGVFCVPGVVDLDRLNEYIEQFKLDGVVIATGGAERKSNHLDYSMPGVALSRHFIDAIHRPLDYGEPIHALHLSSRGGIPRRVMIEGGGRIVQDLVAGVRSLQAIDVFRHVGADVDSIDPRLLLKLVKRPGDPQNMKMTQGLERNLASLGYNIDRTGTVMVAYRNTKRDMRFLDPVGPYFKEAQDRFNHNDEAVVAFVERRREEARQKNSVITDAEAIQEFIRMKDEKYRDAVEAEVNKWLDPYGAKLLEKTTIVGVEERADGDLNVITETPQGERIDIVDCVITSIGTVPVEIPTGLTRPVRVEGIAKGRGKITDSVISTKAATESLIADIRANNGHVSPASDNEAVMNRIHRAWEQTSFDGNILKKFLNEAPPGYIHEWRVKGHPVGAEAVQ